MGPRGGGVRRGRAGEQGQALHPRRAAVVPPVGLVAEVVVDLVIHAAAVEEAAVEVAQGGDGAGGVIGCDGELVPGGLRGDGADSQRRRLAVAGPVDMRRVRLRHEARFAEPAEVPAAVEMPGFGGEARLHAMRPRREQLQDRPTAGLGDHGVVLQRELVAEGPLRGAVEWVVPAAQHFRRDPKGGRHRVGQDRRGVAAGGPVAEEQRGRPGARGRQLTQPGAVHGPHEVGAFGAQRPVFPGDRIAAAVGENHAAQLESGGGRRQRLRRAAATLEPAARLIHRAGEGPGPPVGHPPLPGRARRRQQGLRLQRAVRATQREGREARPVHVHLNAAEPPSEDDRRGKGPSTQGGNGGQKRDVAYHGSGLPRSVDGGAGCVASPRCGDRPHRAGVACAALSTRSTSPPCLHGPSTVCPASAAGSAQSIMSW